MLRNKTAQTHSFSVIPESHLPRSRFKMPQTRKMAFNASELIPILVEPVLPGDVWQHKESVLARLATPIAPLADDLDLETFYFFVPNRISWDEDKWQDLITGTDENAVLPTIIPSDLAGGVAVIYANSVFDHMGLLPQIYTGSNPLNVLPIWAYFEIWNKWFRDENLQEEWEWPDTWGTGVTSKNITQGGVGWNQQCLRVNKRHDLFTSALPWPQKGAAVTMPLGSTAPVTSTGVAPSFGNGVVTWPGPVTRSTLSTNASANVQWTGGVPSAGGPLAFAAGQPTGLQADLSAATAATLNSLRLASVTQQLLELDARGGSRYVENLLAHWGVRSPDFRLQNPEYLGGSKIGITVNPIAQTAAYDAEPGPSDSAIGNLGAEMHAQSTRGTFTYAATEHGYIVGVAVLRATPTYQQGTRRHWLMETRYDFPDPVLMNIGEQALKTQELYQSANNIYTNETWGYQEAWAQWRFIPNEITGTLRSTNPTPMDWWHLSEEFASEPALNATFITDKTQETLARALATAPNEQWSTQCIMDITHFNTVARIMPAYSVPGLRRF